MTARSCLLDYDTAAGSDKFGNFFILRSVYTLTCCIIVYLTVHIIACSCAEERSMKPSIDC
jgi:hypothetical protein